MYVCIYQLPLQLFQFPTLTRSSGPLVTACHAVFVIVDNGSRVWTCHRCHLVWEENKELLNTICFQSPLQSQTILSLIFTDSSPIFPTTLKQEVFVQFCNACTISCCVFKTHLILVSYWTQTKCVCIQEETKKSNSQLSDQIWREYL